jgi:hypothetical protein
MSELGGSWLKISNFESRFSLVSNIDMKYSISFDILDEEFLLKSNILSITEVLDID